MVNGKGSLQSFVFKEIQATGTIKNGRVTRSLAVLSQSVTYTLEYILNVGPYLLTLNIFPGPTALSKALHLSNFEIFSIT